MLSDGGVFDSPSKPLDPVSLSIDKLKEPPEEVSVPVQPTFSTKEDHEDFNSWYYEKVDTKHAKLPDPQKSSAKSKVSNASSPTTILASNDGELEAIPLNVSMEDELSYTDCQDMFKENTKVEGKFKQHTLPGKKIQGSEILLYLQAIFVLLISVYRNEFLDPKLSFPASPYLSPVQSPTSSKQPRYSSRSVAVYDKNQSQPCTCQKLARTLSSLTVVVSSLCAALSVATEWGRGRVSDLKETLKHRLVSVVLGDGWKAMRVNVVKTHEEIVNT